MNSEDFIRGMNRNDEWEAKRQAQLDAMYEAERRKYDNRYGNSSSSNQIYNQPSTQSSDINSRLNRIESRIDKLYELIGQNDNSQINLDRVSDKLFVFAPMANITARQAIVLTDAQFQALITTIMK